MKLLPFKIKFGLFGLLLWLPIIGNAQMLPGNYVIANNGSLSHVIDIPDARFYDGAKLQVWDYFTGGDNQHFRIDAVGGGYILIRTVFNTNYALDVTDGKVENGTPIQIWSAYPKSNNQRWKLEKVKGSIYIIRSALNENYVLSVAKNTHNGSKLILERYTGSSHQQWVIMEEGGVVHKAYCDVYDHRRK